MTDEELAGLGGVETDVWLQGICAGPHKICGFTEGVRVVPYDIEFPPVHKFTPVKSLGWESASGANG
jgi:hypothetical protein